MKRNLIMAVFAVAVIGGINVFNAQESEPLSDIALANVEALAENESIYDYKQPKTVVCDMQEGPWHTGAVERICVFCAVPYSCTPMPCGGN